MVPSVSTTQRLQVADGRHGVLQFIYLQLKKVYHLAVINSFPRHTGKQNEHIRYERDSEMGENRAGKRKESSLLHFEIYGLTMMEQLCGE